MDAVILEIEHISKSFFGVKVLDDIGFSIRRGEVHALMGENGAGKSTLINIIGGIHRANEGRLIYCGKEDDIKDPQDAKKLGISVIHQEIALCENFTVADNIVLGEEPVTPLFTLDRRQRDILAEKAIRAVDDKISISSKVSELSIAQQQVVEIAKAIAFNASLVIMDEPTSSLSGTEVQNLYKVVNELKKRGVAILYVSHRMEEIFDLADRITVLRDGKYIGTMNKEETNETQLIQMLVGRELTDIFSRSPVQTGEIALEVKNLSANGNFHDIDLTVRKGEIVGLFGLVGAGRTELARVIFGIDRYDSGEVKVFGETIKMSGCADALSKGVALIPENRKEQGVVLTNSIGFNASLCVLNQVESLFCLRERKLDKIIGEYLERLHVKMLSVEQLVANLSGGNQQKVVLAKLLAAKPSILIMDEPTRGIDVGAKFEIYSLIDQLVSEGVAILLISSELPEIINMSDRVYVMSDGSMAGCVEGEDIDQVKIMKLAIGGRQDAARK